MFVNVCLQIFKKILLMAFTIKASKDAIEKVDFSFELSSSNFTWSGTTVVLTQNPYEIFLWDKHG